MSWGAVLLSYVGIVLVMAYGVTIGAYNDAQLAHEARVREEGICRVVNAVHENAEFRANTEQNRVLATVEYLTDPRVPRDQLYKRIKANLNQAREDRDVARDAVSATEPPTVCQKYK